MSDINNLQPIQTLKPFTKFCCSIGAIPSSYMVSLTYEEQLLWLCDYLQNTIIPTVNNNGEAVTELQNLYTQLKSYVDNYFTNLDVQTEINNKLDQMASDGTLDTILSKFTSFIHIKDYGAIGDGITDNSEILQNIFDNYNNIFIDSGVYYSSTPLNIKSNTNIIGNGTLKSDLLIHGNIGETINYSTLEINKINTDYIFNINDLLLIFYENLQNKQENKRQMNTTSSINGSLSNNLINFNNNFSIRKINSIKNIKIDSIIIEGNIDISYSQDIYINNISLFGKNTISNSYNINVTNSLINLGNEDRIDVFRGSSNINLDNLIIKRWKYCKR